MNGNGKNKRMEKDIEFIKAVQNALGMNLKEYREFKSLAMDSVIDYGNTFMQALGFALSCADEIDSLKILRYWLNPFENCILLQKIHEAK